MKTATNETPLIDMHISPGDNEILVSFSEYNKIVLPFAATRQWAPRDAIEFSGVITALGAGVHGYSAGDEVFGFMPGMLPFFSDGNVLTKPWQLTLKPQNVSHRQAARIPYASLTAWQALFDHGMLRAGQSVVIVTDCSPVGHYAVQLARHANASVEHVTVDADLTSEFYVGNSRTAIADLLINASNVRLSAPLLNLIREGGRVIILNDLCVQPALTSKNIHFERCITMMYHDELKQIAAMLEEGSLTAHDAEIFSPYKSTFTQCSGYEQCDSGLLQVV